MLFLNKSLTPLQRHSMQRIGGVMGLTVVANSVPHFAPALAAKHASIVYAVGLCILTLAPVLLAVRIAANYLRHEQDEFIRALVVRALLWAFAITMAADAIVGVLTTVYNHPFPIALLNADVFFASAGISFRLLRRAYQ
jgi:hypothetical protein